jgi:hypothetical protein
LFHVQVQIERTQTPFTQIPLSIAQPSIAIEGSLQKEIPVSIFFQTKEIPPIQIWITFTAIQAKWVTGADACS